MQARCGLGTALIMIANGQFNKFMEPMVFDSEAAAPEAARACAARSCTSPRLPVLEDALSFQVQSLASWHSSPFKGRLLGSPVLCHIDLMVNSIKSSPA
jgi:hypothetical protein